MATANANANTEEVVVAMNAGTSQALALYLGQHPQVRALFLAALAANGGQLVMPSVPQFPTNLQQ